MCVGLRLAGRSYLECKLTDLTQLLLGHLDVAEAVSTGKINASTRVAAETASVLFPLLPFWRPAFDDLQGLPVVFCPGFLTTNAARVAIS